MCFFRITGFVFGKLEHACKTRRAKEIKTQKCTKMWRVAVLKFIEWCGRIFFTILLGNAVVNNAVRISVFNRSDVFPFAASLLSFDVVFAKSYGVPRNARNGIRKRISKPANETYYRFVTDGEAFCSVASGRRSGRTHHHTRPHRN